MTPEEQLELDQIKQDLRQTKLLLEQETGKRIAVERDSYETKRQAKLVEEQAAALKAETDLSLSEAAQQMQIALAVSQGIWSFAHLGRAFLARKVAAGRIVHREKQLCLLMEQLYQSAGKNPEAFKAAEDKAKSVIETINRDGEATRLQAAEASLSYGLKEFEKLFDNLVVSENTYNIPA